MQYLTTDQGFTKSFILAFAHGAYVAETPSYEPSYTTKYKYEPFQHPEDPTKWAIGNENWDTLPDIYKPAIVDDQYMIDNGWKLP